MCNFLAGLRKRLDGDGSDKLFDQATLQVTSINYLRILSQPLRFPLRRKQRRLHSKRSFNRHHRHGQLSSIPANSIFHSEFFTDDFYKEFLKIYVQ
nr:Bm73 [Brugia malayi]